MRQLTRIMLLVAGAAVLASAQTAVSRWNGYGYYSYGVMSGGGWSRQQPIGAGGGAEVFLTRRFALGADIGYQGESRYGHTNGMGIFDAGARFHFIDPQKRKPADPFITFGGGFGFDSGPGDPGGLASVGGGVNWWFKPRVGLRTEFRGNAFTAGEAGLFMMRIGLVFR